MHDPIADMFSRIRNASIVRKADVVLPYSKMKLAIASLLKEEGYVDDVLEEEEPHHQIRVKLKYLPNGKPAILSIQMVSRESNRIYRPAKSLPYVLNNLGIAIVSTSKGLMTNKQARKQSLGGEVICEVY
ncbi:MAG: 30S ribosomal protein S8 [Candidatus Kerfeldbacteria bacterium]|nr:30S ribosomal protein S8 [Candidatus Kerfeldbacteria bacterium]